MGKVAVGCLLVIVLAAAAGGGVVWFKVIKPGMEFAGDAVNFGEEFQRIERAIEDRSPYAPPDNGALSEQQFQNFLASQQRIRSHMETQLDELNEKYSELKARFDKKDPGLRDLTGVYRDFGDLLLEAKRAQVEALNSNKFSLQEYAWVRQQVYLALGEPIDAMAVTVDGRERPRGGRVPEETVALVAPHRETLMETHALAWWGL